MQVEARTDVRAGRSLESVTLVYGDSASGYSPTFLSLFRFLRPFFSTFGSSSDCFNGLSSDLVKAPGGDRRSQRTV